MELPVTLLSFFGPTSTICPPCDDFYGYSPAAEHSGDAEPWQSAERSDVGVGPLPPQSYTALSINSLPGGLSPPSDQTQLPYSPLYHVHTTQPSLLLSAPSAGAGEASAENCQQNREPRQTPKGLGKARGDFP